MAPPPDNHSAKNNVWGFYISNQNILRLKNIFDFDIAVDLGTLSKLASLREMYRLGSSASVSEIIG